jgi:hypothetical protein
VLGVGVIVGVVEIVGVIDGVGVTSQSNKAEKSKSQAFVGDGVGVGQTPEKQYSEHKSGQTS